MHVRADSRSPAAGDARTHVGPAGAPTPRRPPTVVAAGDISPTRLGPQQATARLVRRLQPTRVLALGDLQYPDGSLYRFQSFYAPTWGRFKARTEPAPGNHEYGRPGARGYFAYFGKAATRHGRSYYSFDLGGWHLISLNSNIGTGPGSAQDRWLRADLRRTSKRCILAYWHHPRFSSGTEHGDDPRVGRFWLDLYRSRADVVLGGHEHNYEVFRRQTPGGLGDAHGIRQFVVGTGGAGLYPFGKPEPNSRVRRSKHDGILQLTLHPGSYAWRFVAVNGQVLDRGGPVACH